MIGYTNLSQTVQIIYQYWYVLCTYRAQAMELVFSEQLFPADFPVVERAKCWISFFSVFDENDVKALERILQQKQRYLNLC
jgi:hypothetical protein